MTLVYCTVTMVMQMMNQIVGAVQIPVNKASGKAGVNKT